MKTLAIAIALVLVCCFAGLTFLTFRAISRNADRRDWGRDAIRYARHDPDMRGNELGSLAVNKVSHSSAEVVTVYLNARFGGDTRLEVLEVVFHNGVADDISQVSP